LGVDERNGAAGRPGPFPDADVESVRAWVREFATAMTMPDLLEGFEKLLARRRSSSKA
jgi:hypothetical protein